MVSAPDPAVAAELWTLLPESNGQLGAVARCLHHGVEDRAAIVEEGAAANSGAVGNLLATIRAIHDGEIPRAPSISRNTLSATRSFLRQHRPVLSPAAVEHLERLIGRLDESATDVQALVAEETALQARGDSLEEALAADGGVYVYTYPHYWRYPTEEGTRRTALKVGMTTRDATTRVRQQARLTGLPEDPLILRVYRSSSRTPRQMEQAFHRLLNAADHTRDTTERGGTEWFSTSVEFLDAIAQTLDFEALQADTPP